MSGIDEMVSQVIREDTIAPAGHFAAEMKRNQVLRIVDVEGQQVADLVCFKLGRIGTTNATSAEAAGVRPGPGSPENPAADPKRPRRRGRR